MVDTFGRSRNWETLAKKYAVPRSSSSMPHDKIILELMDERSMLKMLLDLGFKPNTRKRVGLLKAMVEVPINSGNYLVGFVDLSIHKVDSKVEFFSRKGRMLKFPIWVEVKPYIRSFGELMRQINLYRLYCNGDFIVVTNVLKHKENIESQGVMYYVWDKPK